MYNCLESDEYHVILSSTVETYKLFAYNAREWWDPTGPFKALHSMNTVRVPLITAALQKTDGGVAGGVAKPLAGYSVLDVGCGAGILSEVKYIVQGRF